MTNDGAAPAAEGLTWAEVVARAPELAAAVAARFAAHRHHVLATLHPDGRPRVTGTNVLITDGRLWIGTMAGAPRVHDLDARPRCALHSAPLDEHLPPGSGDARVEARAVRLSTAEAEALLPDADDVGAGDYHELLVTSLSLAEVDADTLVVRHFDPVAGVTVRRRR